MALWTITSGVGTIDGFTGDYSTIAPGDVIEFAPGTRGVITIRNLIGTAENPIIIQNGDGEVVINAPVNYGMYLRNLSYVTISGNAHDQAYGIRIERAWGFGIFADAVTRHVHITHLKFEVISGGSEFGIHFQTRSSTDTPYDLNGDGSNDIYNRDTVVCDYNRVSYCYFDGGVNRDMNMAMYLGNSSPEEMDGTYHCMEYPRYNYLEVDHNYITRTAWKPLQVGNVMEGGSIHDNTIVSCAGLGTEHIAININPSAGIRVYNNSIIDCPTIGIRSTSNGGYYYNNLIYDCGDSTAESYYAYGIVLDEASQVYYPITENSYILNNTIISQQKYGIGSFASVGGLKWVQNNIILASAVAATSLPSDGTYTTDHNLISALISAGGFVDASNDNYQLAAGSDAIDAGVDVSGYGITTDGTGVTNRLIGVATDLGCYEYGVAPTYTLDAEPGLFVFVGYDANLYVQGYSPTPAERILIVPRESRVYRVRRS